MTLRVVLKLISDKSAWFKKLTLAIKGMLPPIFCIDINTHSEKK